jgi:hypothetical protein
MAILNKQKCHFLFSKTEQEGKTGHVLGWGGGRK